MAVIGALVEDYADIGIEPYRFRFFSRLEIHTSSLERSENGCFLLGKKFPAASNNKLMYRIFSN